MLLLSATKSFEAIYTCKYSRVGKIATKKFAPIVFGRYVFPGSQIISPTSQTCMPSVKYAGSPSNQPDSNSQSPTKLSPGVASNNVTKVCPGFAPDGRSVQTRNVSRNSLGQVSGIYLQPVSAGPARPATTASGRQIFRHSPSPHTTVRSGLQYVNTPTSGNSFFSSLSSPSPSSP